jgi:SAM-dependent methyltransferase
VFSEVYARNAWGGQAGEFCSGAGSTTTQAEAYASMIREFARQRGVGTIVDIGCGDFRVGSLLRERGVRYIGVDVVPALIDRNNREFADDEVSFVCLDLLTEPLPPADLCVVRQVFQHLSNEEIAVALQKVARYRYCIVTEHIPAPERRKRFNADKPHGADTRLLDGSGVYLEQPPFSRAVVVLLEVPVEQPLVARGEVLRTVLLSG